MTDIPENHQPNDEPTIARHDNLRNALSLLLRTGASKLTVR